MKIKCRIKVGSRMSTQHQLLETFKIKTKTIYLLTEAGMRGGFFKPKILLVPAPA